MQPFLMSNSKYHHQDMGRELGAGAWEWGPFELRLKRMESGVVAQV